MISKEKVYQDVNWKTVDITIKDNKGKVICSKNGVSFPDFYSQTAMNIYVSKYFTENEYSLDQFIDRYVNTIAKAGSERGYFNTGITKEAFIYKLKYMILHQYFQFNSPVLFNIGNPAKKGKEQASACFINEVDDTMEDIMGLCLTEGLIYKQGSGSGTNLSNIRSKHESISGGGKASGVCSWLKIYDTVGGSTKSGGTVRRSAAMRRLDCDHGDLEEFICCKSEQEKIAQILISNGFSPNMNDSNSAYNMVFYQNGNHTVGVSNAFMNSAISNTDDEWYLLERYPTEFDFSKTTTYLKSTLQGDLYGVEGNGYLIRKDDGQFYKTIASNHASYYLRLIAENASITGCPGIQFDDTINKVNPILGFKRIRASNPCGEHMFLDNTACNLSSFNLLLLMRLYKKESSGQSFFDWLMQKEYIYIAVMAMDILVDYSSYPNEKITKTTKRYRPLGLGYTNLGALLIENGYAYGSKESLELIAEIGDAINTLAFNASLHIGTALGAFDGIEEALNLDVMINNFKESSRHTSYWDKIYTDRESLRNAQLTLLAPTGTISFVMDCETTGIEPIFDIVTYKTTVDGITMPLLTPVVNKFIEEKGYDTKKVIDEYIRDGVLPNDIVDVLKGANSISYKHHIDVMSTAQMYLTGAISKTINLPNSATTEDIIEVYLYAWRQEIKGITIYRDGCKSFQPLNSGKQKEQDTAIETKESAIINVSGRRKLPNTRNGVIHKFSIGGNEGYFTIGLYENGKPGEIFININKQGSTVSGLADLVATMASIALQHGASIDTIIDKFEYTKYEPSGFTTNEDIKFASSLTDYIAKWLKLNYLENNDVNELKNNNEYEEKNTSVGDGSLCDNCGNPTVKAGTCRYCPNCGNTSGCS